MKKIAVALPVFNGNEKKYINECIDTGWISSVGKFVTMFEEKFAEYCGVKYALTCANGTVSLHLALLALGIGEGDEVVVPTLTYIATANVVKYCSATPVFVDCDEKTWNMDVKKIEEKITPRTKAIMPTHLYGNPSNMDEIRKLADKYNLFVVEDAAEAHGAIYNGKKVGSLGDIGSFSFFGNKIITSGEGGMVTTNDYNLYEKMKILRSQGMDSSKRYWHSVIGFNYRMTNLQAAVGLAQLENIDWHINNRDRVMKLYKEKMKNLETYIEFQKEEENSESVNWMTSVLLKGEVCKHRDFIMERLSQLGIETRPLFYPMHIMPPYYETNSNYSVSEDIAARGINLPSHALISEDDVNYIVESIQDIIHDILRKDC